MFDEIDVNQYKRNFDHIRRFLGIFIGTTAVSQLLFFIPYFTSEDYAGNFYISKFNLYMCVIATFFLYFSLVRISYSYDKCYRQEFFESDTDSKLKFWLTNKRFWIESAVLAGLYIIFPLKLLNYGIVYFLNNKGGIFQNQAFVLFILLLLMFVINLLARLTATNYWIQDKALSENPSYEIRKNYKRSSYLKEYTVAIFAYLIGGLGAGEALTYLLLLISPVLNLAFNYFKVFVILLFVLLGVPFIFRIIRSLVMRYSFIRKLEKLCKRNKYRLSLLKNPYASIFKDFKGESFCVTIGKETYSCKLIAATRRHTPLYLRPNGTGVFVRIFHILRAEAFRRTKEIDFQYESKYKQILIINPIPKMIFSNHNSLIGELDIGDKIGSFKIYSSSSFLNALERNVIYK